ncbi:hypothetical protein L600_001500000540 [Isoptericola variabilis J7]|nr:hypothetical protein L600_001500000540 [Isoptericola variabilis J7]
MPLGVTVVNGGGRVASETYVRLELPQGLRPAAVTSPQGASVPVGDLSAEMLACTPVATAEREVLCAVGTLEPGEERTVAFPVVARLGGEYPIRAHVWAEGLETETIALPPTSVSSYGAELTAASAAPAVLENPGEGWIPVDVTNTGDTAATGWSVDVAVPAGLTVVGSDGDLVCEAGDERWTCRPGELAPELAAGESRSGRLRVVADGTTPAGTVSASVQPVLEGSDHVVPAAAPVTVGVPWERALAATAALEATCDARGGVDTADAVVRATYVNTSSSPVTVRLAAGGTSTQDHVVAPGQSVSAHVHDGLRVPAGPAHWHVTASVAGSTFSTEVPAGRHGAVDCYDPAWEIEATAKVVNVGGTVGVEGTVTNLTNETMQVGMIVAGASAAPVRLGAGQTTTLTADTGRTSVPDGEATFTLYRWVTDHDGDQPEHGVTPSAPKTAPYGQATVAPRLGGDRAEPSGECRFDPSADASYHRFEIPLDNRRSTLPATFAVTVLGIERTQTVPAGETGVLAVAVPWGTETLEVRADGRVVGTVRVAFESCATEGWPASDVDVKLTAQCLEDRAHVVADVTNRGDAAWTATLVRGSATATADVAPGGAARVAVDTGGLTTSPGTAVVQLSREHEGRTLTAERELRHGATSCVRTEPEARLAVGQVSVATGAGGNRTSTREVDLVLDNSRSNVAVEFAVVGPGVDRTVEVPAGQVRTVDAGAVQGRHGATFRATAASRTSPSSASRGPADGARRRCAEVRASPARSRPTAATTTGSWPRAPRARARPTPARARPRARVRAPAPARPRAGRRSRRARRPRPRARRAGTGSGCRPASTAEGAQPIGLRRCRRGGRPRRRAPGRCTSCR